MALSFKDKKGVSCPTHLSRGKGHMHQWSLFLMETGTLLSGRRHSNFSSADTSPGVGLERATHFWEVKQGKKMLGVPLSLFGTKRIKLCRALLGNWALQPARKSNRTVARAPCAEERWLPRTFLPTSMPLYFPKTKQSLWSHMLLSSDSFKWCQCVPGSYGPVVCQGLLQRKSAQHPASPSRTAWEPIYIVVTGHETSDREEIRSQLPFTSAWFWMEWTICEIRGTNTMLTVQLTLMIVLRTAGLWVPRDFLLVGVSPLFSGVLGGKFSSNNSGLRCPPKDTRLLFIGIPSLLSEVRNANTWKEQYKRHASNEDLFQNSMKK